MAVANDLGNVGRGPEASYASYAESIGRYRVVLTAPATGHGLFLDSDGIFKNRLPSTTAHAADNTAAGGNARGTGAVDWQTARGLATQVASGVNASIGGGQNNVASGSVSTVGGGFTNEATGAYSWIAGGSRATTRGQYGRASHASGMFAVTGDAQTVQMVLRRQTTDNTPTVLTADGGAPSGTNQYVLANNSVAAVRVLVAARDTTNNAKAAWDLFAMVRRDASAGSTLVTSSAFTTPATPSAAAGAGISTVTVQLKPDTTNGGLQIEVVGIAATNITFVAHIIAVEVVAS